VSVFPYIIYFFRKFSAI